MFKVRSKFWLTCYEGEDTLEGGAGGDKKITFTAEQQAHINSILAKEKDTHKKAAEKLAGQLQEALKVKGLTDKKKQELETQLEELRGTYMTAEQRAAEAAEKLKKDSENQIKALSTEAETWKNKYTNSTITRDIYDAAMAEDAYQAEQLAAILRPMTRLAETVDGEGKPTGEFVSKIKWSDTKDGKQIQLDLTPKEVAKKMREMDQYANLFKTKAAGGLGGKSGDDTKSGPVDFKNMSPEAYREYRKKNK
jgi:hypothetical protein